MLESKKNYWIKLLNKNKLKFKVEEENEKLVSKIKFCRKNKIRSDLIKTAKSRQHF